MVAKSGDALLQDEAVAALVETLLPRATLLTPNLPEAARLLGCRAGAGCRRDGAQGEALVARGAGAVLMKGGHGGGATCTDVLVLRGAGPMLARGAAARHAEHARHRLHAVGRNRGGAGERTGAGRPRCARRTHICRRRSGGRQAVGRPWPRPGASFPRGSRMVAVTPCATVIGAGVAGLCVATEIAARGGDGAAGRPRRPAGAAWLLVVGRGHAGALLRGRARRGARAAPRPGGRRLVGAAGAAASPARALWSSRSAGTGPSSTALRGGRSGTR